MIKIKATKELFEAWDQLGRKISALKSIAQNDMEVEDLQFDKWDDMVYGLSYELKELWKRTLVSVGKEGDF